MVHQFPGVPVAVPGSPTGSRPGPTAKSYMAPTMGAVASSRLTWRRRGMARTVVRPGRLRSGPGYAVPTWPATVASRSAQRVKTR